MPDPVELVTVQKVGIQRIPFEERYDSVLDTYQNQMDALLFRLQFLHPQRSFLQFPVYFQRRDHTGRVRAGQKLQTQWPSTFVTEEGGFKEKNVNHTPYVCTNRSLFNAFGSERDMLTI